MDLDTIVVSPPVWLLKPKILIFDDSYYKEDGKMDSNAASNQGQALQENSVQIIRKFPIHHCLNDLFFLILHFL